MAKDDCYRLERIKPNHLGYKETCIYVGNLKDKPRGWRVKTYLGKTGCEPSDGLHWS